MDGKRVVRDVAVNIGCKWNTLDNYLHGRTQLGKKTLKKLESILRIEPGKLPPKLEPIEKRRGPKLQEATVPYRTEPNLSGELLLSDDTLPSLARKLAGLISDEGVPARFRLANGEFLFNEIKRRLQILASSDLAGSALLAKAVSSVEAVLPSEPASARGGISVPQSDVPRKPPAPQSKL